MSAMNDQQRQATHGFYFYFAYATPVAVASRRVGSVAE